MILKFYYMAQSMFLSHLLVVASNAEEEEEDAKFAELVLPNRTFGVSRLGFFSGISVLA